MQQQPCAQRAATAIAAVAASGAGGGRAAAARAQDTAVARHLLFAFFWRLIEFMLMTCNARLCLDDGDVVIAQAGFGTQRRVVHLCHCKAAPHCGGGPVAPAGGAVH
jgi:hypothetical protein